MTLWMSCVAYAQNVTLNNIWVEHVVNKYNSSGITIHTTLAAKDMEGQMLNIYCRFYNKDGTSNFGRKTSYCFSNGATVTYLENLKCTSQNAIWKDLSFFLPYDALQHTDGKNEYSFLIQVSTKTTPNVAYTKKQYFNVTYDNGLATSTNTDYTAIYGSISPEQDFRNLGSCPTLSGKIAVVQYYVSYPLHVWDNDNIYEMQSKTLEAENWLQSQARKYGSNVTFQNFFYGISSTVMVNDPQEIIKSKGIGEFIPFLMEEQGYSGDNWHTEFMNWANSVGCDKCMVLVFINESGRTISLPYNREMKEANSFRNFVEGSMIYRLYTTRMETRASSIAHEMLHVCGAWDLYSDKLSHQSQENAERAKVSFPNSIMITTPSDIKSTMIDELTAWLIGINKNKKDWYESFEPKIH